MLKELEEKEKTLRESNEQVARLREIINQLQQERDRMMVSEKIWWVYAKIISFPV